MPYRPPTHIGQGWYGQARQMAAQRMQQEAANALAQEQLSWNKMRTFTDPLLQFGSQVALKFIPQVAPEESMAVATERAYKAGERGVGVGEAIGQQPAVPSEVEDFNRARQRFEQMRQDVIQDTKAAPGPGPIPTQVAGGPTAPPAGAPVGGPTAPPPPAPPVRKPTLRGLQERIKGAPVGAPVKPPPGWGTQPEHYKDLSPRKRLLLEQWKSGQAAAGRQREKEQLQAAAAKSTLRRGVAALVKDWDHTATHANGKPIRDYSRANVKAMRSYADDLVSGLVSEAELKGLLVTPAQKASYKATGDFAYRRSLTKQEMKVHEDLWVNYYYIMERQATERGKATIKAARISAAVRNRAKKYGLKGINAGQWANGVDRAATKHGFNQADQKYKVISSIIHMETRDANARVNALKKDSVYGPIIEDALKFSRMKQRPVKPVLLGPEGTGMRNLQGYYKNKSLPPGDVALLNELAGLPKTQAMNKVQKSPYKEAYAGYKLFRPAPTPIAGTVASGPKGAGLPNLQAYKSSPQYNPKDGPLLDELARLPKKKAKAASSKRKYRAAYRRYRNFKPATPARSFARVKVDYDNIKKKLGFYSKGQDYTDKLEKHAKAMIKAGRIELTIGGKKVIGSKLRGGGLTGWRWSTDGSFDKHKLPKEIKDLKGAGYTPNEAWLQKQPGIGKRFERKNIKGRAALIKRIDSRFKKYMNWTQQQFDQHFGVEGRKVYQWIQELKGVMGTQWGKAGTQEAPKGRLARAASLIRQQGWPASKKRRALLAYADKLRT